MKFYLSIILFTGLAIGQVEYVEDFLNNPKKLKLLKNYNLIKPRISRSQRQRIALARAFYFNKKIIILDESTNSLEKKREYDIK